MPTRTNTESKRELAAIAALLVLSAVFNFTHLGWGLPNGDATWAPDALTPMTPLSIASRLVRGGFNSGWFWYKYPLGHPLVLAIAYAPYLGWLRLTGGLGTPVNDYPYGFSNPEHALFMLSLIGRGVSAAMASGAVLFWYLTCRELLSRRTALLAACFLATLFPAVYYAHTTNVDGPMTFWCTLAMYGAARTYTRPSDWLGVVLYGIGAAMALSTKEQSLGLLLAAPLVVVAARWWDQRSGKPVDLVPRGFVIGLAAGVILFAFFNGVLTNPTGMWHRVQFLMHTLPESLKEKYAVHYHPVGSIGPRALGIEWSHLTLSVAALGAAIGVPLLLAAIVGVLLRGWRREGLFFLVPSIGYYLISVRSLQTVRPRFVLLLAVLATSFAAMAFDAAWASSRKRSVQAAVTAVAAGVVAFGALRGADAVRLMMLDPRYAAERWLSANVSTEQTVEVYQPPLYLPRFAQSTRVPFRETSLAGFQQRRPDFIVLSSAGIAGVTSKYASDWQAEDGQDEGDNEGERSVSGRGIAGHALAYEYERNRVFMQALQDGCLAYAPVATFSIEPSITPAMMPNLGPTVIIYGRGEATAADTDSCRELLAPEKSQNG